MGDRPECPVAASTKGEHMPALIVLVLILLIFGGIGFAVHFLWYVLIIAVLLWLIGFFVGGVSDGGGRRWYGRW
jgi:energy-coupling factor transporter transmembrane protein EcfT